MYKSLERITVISEILSESDVEIPDLKNITHLSDQISRAQDLKRTLAKESIREMMIEVGLESYPNIDDRYFKGIEKIKDKIKSLEDISHERKRYSGIDTLPTSVELPDIQTLQT